MNGIHTPLTDCPSGQTGWQTCRCRKIDRQAETERQKTALSINGRCRQKLKGLNQLRTVKNFTVKYMSLIMRKCVLCHYAINKGADQPAHLCSLISTFVIHCLCNTYSYYIPNSKPLASLCISADRFESYLVANPKDRFSHDVALYVWQQKCFGIGRIFLKKQFVTLWWVNK